MRPPLSWLRTEIGPRVGSRAQDLEYAARAVLTGGECIEPLYSVDSTPSSGRWGGPVTEADRASHDAILDLLTGLAPGDAIRSEEGGEDEWSGDDARPEDRLWLVDPLDGTREFLARNGEFSVMVGLSEDGKGVLGAVYQPTADRLYLGVADVASWVVDRPSGEARIRRMRIDEGTDRQPWRVVRSRSHGDRRLEQLKDLPGGVEWIVSGSVGIKCALISEGKADLYVHPVPYLKEWDTCAPEAILRGAGGKVTDCDGKALGYGKRDPHQPGGIFAARPMAWSSAAPLVKQLFRGEDDVTGKATP